MSLFNKFKNLFFEDEIQEEFKKEDKEILKEEKVEEKKEEPIKEEPIIKNEPKFKFPIAFEDEDFESKEEPKDVIMIEKKYKMPEVPKREEKAFKLTPIISPVYGVLDKNYKKEEVVSVKDGLLDNEVETDIDAVRSKAYGVKKTREEKYSNNEIESVKETEINLFLDNEKPVEEESYELNEIDEKIKTIDELLKETTDDDSLYSLVNNMYKDEEEGEDIN